MKPNRRLPFDLLSVATAFGVVVAVAALAYPAFKANPMSGPGMILIVTAGLIALIGLGLAIWEMSTVQLLAQGVPQLLSGRVLRHRAGQAGAQVPPLPSRGRIW